jgi:hypothetical protein
MFHDSISRPANFMAGLRSPERQLVPPAPIRTPWWFRAIS